MPYGYNQQQYPHNYGAQFMGGMGAMGRGMRRFGAGVYRGLQQPNFQYPQQEDRPDQHMPRPRMFGQQDQQGNDYGGIDETPLASPLQRFRMPAPTPMQAPSAASMLAPGMMERLQRTIPNPASSPSRVHFLQTPAAQSGAFRSPFPGAFGGMGDVKAAEERQSMYPGAFPGGNIPRTAEQWAQPAPGISGEAREAVGQGLFRQRNQAAVRQQLVNNFPDLPNQFTPQLPSRSTIDGVTRTNPWSNLRGNHADAMMGENRMAGINPIQDYMHQQQMRTPHKLGQRYDGNPYMTQKELPSDKLEFDGRGNPIDNSPLGNVPPGADRRSRFSPLSRTSGISRNEMKARNAAATEAGMERLLKRNQFRYQMRNPGVFAQGTNQDMTQLYGQLYGRFPQQIGGYRGRQGVDPDMMTAGIYSKLLEFRPDADPQELMGVAREFASQYNRLPGGKQKLPVIPPGAKKKTEAEASTAVRPNYVQRAWPPPSL